MKSLENKLITVLDELMKQNNLMLAVFKKERVCITAFDIDGLRSANADELEIAARIAELDQERVKIVIAFAERFQIDPKGLKLEDLATHVTEEYAGAFRGKRDALRKVMDALVRERNLNNKILEKAIAFNEKHIRLYINAGNKSLTYSNTGQVSQSRRQVLDSIA